MPKKHYISTPFDINEESEDEKSHRSDQYGTSRTDDTYGHEKWNNNQQDAIEYSGKKNEDGCCWFCTIM